MKFSICFQIKSSGNPEGVSIFIVRNGFNYFPTHSSTKMEWSVHVYKDYMKSTRIISVRRLLQGEADWSYIMLLRLFVRLIISWVHADQFSDAQIFLRHHN